MEDLVVTTCSDIVVASYRRGLIGDADKTVWYIEGIGQSS